MVWLAGIAILIIMMILPGFRKYAIAFVLVFAMTVLLVWMYQEKDEERSRKRILPSELAIEDLVLKSSYNGYNLTGRIINNSKKYTLLGLKLTLAFKDCAKDNESNCVVIDEETSFIYINIPPGQAGDFSEGFYPYPQLNVKGKLDWIFKIEYAKAE